MSGGQVVTGLDSGGDINIELSRDPVYDAFILMAMMAPDWTVEVSVGGPFTQAKDPANDQLATITGTFDTADWGNSGKALLPGDMLVFAGFTDPANNGPRQVTRVIDPTSFEVVTPRAATDETSDAAAGVSLPRYVDIGSTQTSITLSKAYTDVTHDVADDVHSQRYTGALINGMSFDLTYGQIVTGSFSFVANGYEQESPSLAQKLVTAGGTVAPAGTAQPLNASVDMPLVTVGGQPTDFCIESLTLTLDNGLSPQNCLGKIAPTKYSLGTASINISASIYLGDPSYDKFMPGKLTQEPVSMLFAAVNADGGYAFDLRAVQLSFPDPASGGKDQQVMIDAEGVAKVGPNGASALRIYRW
jgi:hypothetical protein